MALEHFRMLILQAFKKDPDIVPEESPIIILDNKYAVFVSINGKYIDHTRHNDRRVKSVRNRKM